MIGITLLYLIYALQPEIINQSSLRNMTLQAGVRCVWNLLGSVFIACTDLALLPEWQYIVEYYLLTSCLFHYQ